MPLFCVIFFSLCGPTLKWAGKGKGCKGQQWEGREREEREWERKNRKERDVRRGRERKGRKKRRGVNSNVSPNA
jgi:hypothetical protein